MLLIAVILLLGSTVAVFGDVLFSAEEIVLSRPHTDLYDQFAYWREFGFGEVRRGNLPLWNPHIFSGMPFMGGFQSALLYPLNVVYLILPLSAAINWGIAIHVFLLGTFMYLWTAYRGLHPLACLVSAVMLMFCGAHFLQIQAGHIPHLSTMAWAPLVLLSIDGFFQKRSLGWCLLGMLAVTMQILAGYPQHLFFTAVAAVVYAAFCMIKAEKKAGMAIGLFSMYAGAGALAAVQLLPGLEVAGESIRSGGLSYEFAASFSLPPENLITLLIPGFFGDHINFPYWGRFYPWETTVFIGVTGFVLAIYGAVYGERTLRRFSAVVGVVLILLALGAYTPLFRFLYSWVPGFDRFRGSSKFMFQASLFVAMLAGIGLDQLLRGRRIDNKSYCLLLVFVLLIVGSAMYVRYLTDSTDTAGWWRQALNWIHATKEWYLAEEYYFDDRLVETALGAASRALLIAAGTSLVSGILFFLVRFSRRAAYAIALLAVVEIVVFARSSIATFDMKAIRVPEVQDLLAEQTGDYRIFNAANSNSAMITGMQDIWGYDSVVLRRYAEFMTFTQGYDPGEATQYVTISRLHRLYRMLRCRFALIPSDGSVGIIEENDVMGRLQLIQDYVEAKDRDEIFAIMEDASFDPRETVILETRPYPEPVMSEEKGTARVVDSSTDHLIVEASLPHPAILLITDAYSRGWRACALPGSSQKEYDIIPANYILRAIPMSQGYHRVRIEYLPLAFVTGKWVSLGAILAYVVLILWCVLRGYRRRSCFQGASY